jgi:lipopolysaccharide export LptBFGC system permease protein LptF
MSDEEGAAMLARQQEGKKAKAAERIEKLKETKVARDAEKLAQVNAKREAKGLTVITSLTRKPKVNKQETDMAKAKKGAKAKSANGSWTSNDAVITRLAKGDEYEPRKGTIAARSWEATKAKTYAKFKELKGNPAYLRWFVSHGYVKVTG